MAVSTNEIQVKWGDSNTSSVAAGAAQDSDSFQMSDGAVYAEIIFKAVNGGTPADGDSVDFYLRKISDPDQDSTLDEETVGSFLCQLDISSSATAVKRVCLPVGFPSCKIHVENNGASSVTVSARVAEKVSS